MRIWLALISILLLSACSTPTTETPAPHAPAPGAYLFVWSGDDEGKANDFLAVIDADPKSPRYGEAVAALAVPGPSGTPHHTEMEMPEGGFLFANAFASGKTWLFDLR